MQSDSSMAIPPRAGWPRRSKPGSPCKWVRIWEHYWTSSLLLLFLLSVTTIHSFVRSAMSPSLIMPSPNPSRIFQIIIFHTGNTEKLWRWLLLLIATATAKWQSDSKGVETKPPSTWTDTFLRTHTAESSGWGEISISKPFKRGIDVTRHTHCTLWSV